MKQFFKWVFTFLPRKQKKINLTAEESRQLFHEMTKPGTGTSNLAQFKKTGF